MTREVHQIPPAPRQARWRAVLWCRWPLALLGFVLAVYGGAITLMLALAASGKPRDDVVLDGAAARADAIVRDVVPTRASRRGRPVERVSYTFRTENGATLRGSSFATAGRFEPGRHATVEYDPRRPSRSRLRGTRISLLGDWVTPGLGLAVFPGLLLILLWLQGVMDLKLMLTSGDVAVAEIVSIHELRWVLPGMLAVEYRFRDHRARPWTGRHWVRQRSELGCRLATEPGAIAVVCNRRRARRSRLVISSDFVGAASPSPEPGSRYPA